VQIRITERGEVWLKAAGNFSGYYKNPEATAETLHDGWIATGDAGLLDPDGHLLIIDRVRDVSRLQDGSVFAPQYIENKLKFSPYIREAVALGHDRAFVTAMINIDAEVVGNWAERRSVSYTGYTDLAQNPEVYALILAEVRRTNETLASTQQVRRFALLHKELDADDAEITRTRKLRRRFIHERYRDIIEALYDVTAHAVTVRATVTYEDGRTSEVSRSVRLQDVADA
jgi:long-chain acyl-CoA synthetase